MCCVSDPLRLRLAPRPTLPDAPEPTLPSLLIAVRRASRLGSCRSGVRLTLPPFGRASELSSAPRLPSPVSRGVPSPPGWSALPERVDTAALPIALKADENREPPVRGPAGEARRAPNIAKWRLGGVARLTRRVLESNLRRFETTKSY